MSRLAGVIDKSNAAQWITIARENTTLELLDKIKESKQANGPTDPTASEPLKKKNFSLHEDQMEVVLDALGKAKHELETEYDSVALDGICQNFLSGATVSQPLTGDQQPSIGEPSLKAQMHGAGYLEVLETFDQLWPDITLQIAIPEKMA